MSRNTKWSPRESILMTNKEVCKIFIKFVNQIDFNKLLPFMCYILLKLLITNICNNYIIQHLYIIIIILLCHKYVKYN